MAYTTINKPTDYFDTELFTGTGATQSVTGLNFSPAFTWLNRRIDNTNGNSAMYDINRGVNKSLESHSQLAEQTITGGLTSFDSNGFTLGSNIISNELDQTMCSWNWKAGTSISNGTNGSTQNESTVNVNTASGFSIVTYDGTGSDMSIPHNLGVAPEMILFREVDGSGSWFFYHKYSRLNANTAPEDSAMLMNGFNDAYSTTMWNSTAPTANHFFISGDSTSYNEFGQKYVAYCFASKQGFSKCGTYQGNGNTNGASVFTGFPPAFLLIKLSYGYTSGGRWLIYDAKRGQSGANTAAGKGRANIYADYPVNGESEADAVDFLATGFKIRISTNYTNRNLATMIYYAIADTPLVGTNNVPSTAV
jgi:hypothetical protein